MHKTLLALAVVAVILGPTTVYADQGLSLVEYGSNVTLGQNGEHAFVVAHGSNTLDILLHVRNGSLSPIYNVYVTDMLPGGVNVIPSTTSVNGIIAVDGITSSGLNIGTLSANQEDIVKFSALVEPNSVPAWGQLDIMNTTQVRADGISTVSARLPITLGGAVSIAAISRVKTGPADSILIALLLGVVTTGLYAMYTNTELFNRRMALAEIRMLVSRKDGPNFLS